MPAICWQPVRSLGEEGLPLYYRIADLAGPTWHMAPREGRLATTGGLAAARIALLELADGCPAAGIRLRSATSAGELLSVERVIGEFAQVSHKLVVEFELADIAGDGGILFSALCSLRRFDVSLVCCGFGLVGCSAHDLAALRLAAIQVAEPIIRLHDHDARCHRALRSVRRSAMSFAPLVIAAGVDSPSMFEAALENGFAFGIGAAVGPATLSRPWKLSLPGLQAGSGTCSKWSVQ